jgi:nicotinate phosphoribosyltransferase
MDNRRLELLADFYEFTMANGYFEKNMKEKIVYFDLFFRRVPDDGGYVIVAGLKQVIDYILNLKFDEEDISYLRAQNKFSENFLTYLKDFRFTGDIWAIPEGTVVFPNEPLVTVRAPVIEAQILETMLLLTINHQSLIATKTSRIVSSAKGRTIMEFGARRAHGIDAAVAGARASIIGGCVGTSCTLSAMENDVPVSGTMAHSWIQCFESEYEAFKTYAEIYPENCILLVDTYHTLEVLKPMGIRPKGIRLDSGELAYLSKKARQLLDDAGYPDCKIVASNSLDEHLITSLLNQGAQIDVFGVGENLITAKSEPVFGGVYKLVAIEENDKIIPKIKISETSAKVTNPGFKKLYRFYDKDTHKALADVIALCDEKIPENHYTIFDPESPWKKKLLKNYYVRQLQEKIFDNGKLVYTSPTLTEIAKYSKEELNTIWEEVRRIYNPHTYYVDLSEKLWTLKTSMLNSINHY